LCNRSVPGTTPELHLRYNLEFYFRQNFLIQCSRILTIERKNSRSIYTSNSIKQFEKIGLDCTKVHPKTSSIFAKNKPLKND
jgi:hypothetical protein